MPTEVIQALIAGDVIETSGVKFRIVKVSRFSVNVEIESPGEIELVNDDAPAVGAAARDPNSEGIELT